MRRHHLRILVQEHAHTSFGEISAAIDYISKFCHPLASPPGKRRYSQSISSLLLLEDFSESEAGEMGAVESDANGTTSQVRCVMGAPDIEYTPRCVGCIVVRVIKAKIARGPEYLAPHPLLLLCIIRRPLFKEGAAKPCPRI